MKKIITLIAVLLTTTGFSQAYDGFGDTKLSTGLSFQNGGIGLSVSSDRGMSDYISMGFNFGIVLNAKKIETTTVVNGESYSNEIEASDSFLEKLDLNYRLNGHFGEMIGMSEMSDVYGGLNLGFRNIGSQIGFRYLISDSFGFYAEANVPVAKLGLFGNDSVNYYKFYEQPVGQLGLVFSF